MKIISTRMHGVLDYLTGLFLIAMPWLFLFGGNHISTWIPVILGVAIILYSLFTDYEYGIIPEITMRGHLVLDALAGIILVVSPWLLNFNDIVYLPHMVVGVVLIILSLITQTVPSVVRKRHPI